MFNINFIIRPYTKCCDRILSYVCWTPLTEVPQHALSDQEAPPLSRSRFGRDRSFAAGTRPRADIPDRLRDPLVSVRRMACIRPVRPSSRRIHQAYHALASGTAAANLALSHGRVI